MKRNEIALILVIVGLVVLATYSILNFIFGKSALQPVKEPKATAISATINNPPDKKVFNKDALNPAISVKIGDQSNQQPFNIQQ